MPDRVPCKGKQILVSQRAPAFGIGVGGFFCRTRPSNQGRLPTSILGLWCICDENARLVFGWDLKHRLIENGSAFEDTDDSTEAVLNDSGLSFRILTR